ncbi:MAG: hypothetical protein ACI9BF_000881 [Candidatus Paceibacteria bacterium]|jgi:hypothetical protein
MNFEIFPNKKITTPAETFEKEVEVEGGANQDADKFAEEREWHQERWERQAAASSNKTFFGRQKNSVEDFILEEASRDNEYFDKLKHSEHEAWQADLQPVIDSFIEKMDNPEKECINVIYMKGGGMKSAYTGGQVWALNEMGLTSDKVDYIFGSSSGSVVAATYAGGPEETNKGLRMLTGPLSSPDFISTKRALSGDIIKLEMAEEEMNEGEHAFDEEKIRDYQGKLYFSVTEPPEPDIPVPDVRFLDMKNEEENPSISSRIRSSMSISSRVTGEIPEIDGVKYRDGDYNQLPMSEVIAKVKETLSPGMEGVEINVMILPQTPFEIMDNIKPSQAEYNMASLGKFGGIMARGGIASLSEAQKLLLAREELRKDLEEIQEIEHVKIGILWPPDDGLGVTNIDSDAAQASILSSARDTIKQFGGEQPDSIEY